jgi:acyl phosphate:glycerol-3-phosphate acyltransferase
VILWGVLVLELGIKCLLAYFLGAMIGSLLVGRLRGGVDIRNHGSGNAGGTNALRTQGVWFAVWVMLIDVGKGILAVTLVPDLVFPGLVFAPTIDRAWIVVACAACTVVGHVYPVWHDFRGGKGAATLLGVLAGILPAALAPVLAVWFLTVMLTGFVGLGTVLAATAFPVFLLLQHSAPSPPQLLLAIAMAIFVAYTHRGNIRRMLDGSESRAHRLWMLGPR